MNVTRNSKCSKLRLSALKQHQLPTTSSVAKLENGLEAKSLDSYSGGVEPSANDLRPKPSSRALTSVTKVLKGAAYLAVGAAIASLIPGPIAAGAVVGGLAAGTASLVADKFDSGSSERSQEEKRSHIRSRATEGAALGGVIAGIVTGTAPFVVWALLAGLASRATERDGQAN